MAQKFSLTEQDVRSFLQEAPQPAKTLKNAAVFLCAIIAAGLAGYALLNLPALLYINNVAPLTTQASAAESEVVSPIPTSTPVTVAVVPTPQPEPTIEAPDIPESSLAYEALSISAPIQWDTPMDAKTQNKLLPNGLIQLAGTAHPGEKGMVAIAGHSSNYPWIKGSYNTVFAPLTHSSVGNTIEINYHNTLYRYSISKIYEVKPTDLAILSDNNSTGLRLITCTPVGTSLRRLIVDAVQIYPDPAQNAPFSAGNFSGQLPADQ